jgi:glycosyltransferase involved in cell wall biosynthesis
MRKYLFIAANEWDNWGGSELLWSLTAEKLVRGGNEVRVSVRDFGRPMREVERLRSAGCRIFYRRAFPPFLYRLGSRLFWIPEYNHTHVRSAANGVDLVVISQGGNIDGLPWMERVQAIGRKYVVIVEGGSDLWWPDDRLAERLALSYENAARAYCVSHATLDLCRRQFASPLRHGKVIRNPFNVRYDAKPPWPMDEQGGLSLAFIGRLDGASKGHDLLFQVLALPHWRKRKVRVSLFGTGVNERVLRYMAQDLKLTSVDFLGQVSDIEAVWGKHHALVLPSRFEGMPLVVVEAMLCGRICIVTDVGGNRELVRDGVNGFVAKAATIELLDEAMSRAWDRRRQLQEMGEVAAADVRRWVSQDPIADFVYELEAQVDGRSGQ